ncbi:MAG: NAD-dependent epimerase/dehydratase family protein, partial [Pirellulaceae bacterium]
FHLAGQVNHQRSMAAPRFDWECNCLPTINLLEACRSRNVHARILFTSTRQVYARATSLPVDETHSTQPHDVNAVHKLAAEHYLSVYERSYGIRSTVLRLTNTYGPRQKIACAGQGVAGYFVFQALRGAVLRLYGGGGQRRDFNYVDDVVEAMLLAITTDDCLGEVFNLGAETSHSLREYLDVLREFCVFEVQEVPFPPSAATIEIGDYQGDYGRLRRVCGWSPRIGLQEGLRRTTEFYRAHPQAYGL